MGTDLGHGDDRPCTIKGQDLPSKFCAIEIISCNSIFALSVGLTIICCENISCEKKLHDVQRKLHAVDNDQNYPK